jgi:Tfp pilus assembly protein PilO
MRRWLADLRYSARHPWARAGAWACGCALVAAGAAFAAWWPEQREQAALEEAIVSQRRTLVDARRTEELARAYLQARKEIAALDRKLGHAATQAQLVQDFARLARRHGVRIVSETYEEGRGVQPTLSAELAVQGAYPALRDFVAGLAGLPTWSEVHEVRIESARGAKLQKGRVRIVTYRQAAAGGKAS